MAKKKVTHQENQSENNTKPHQEATTMAAIDEASSEKLESLKSLNSMLIKEAHERREQVVSLMKAKGSLESELTRSNSENEKVKSELTQLREEAVRLDVERTVVFEFVDAQAGQQADAFDRERGEFKREKAEIEKEMKLLEKEMNQILSEKSEIEKVKSDKDSEIVVLNEKMNGLLSEVDKEKKGSIKASRERDELMAKLDVLTTEANELQVILTEAENREKGVKNEVEELAIKYKGMVEEKNERERRIVSMILEKDIIEKSLMETDRIIDKMKGKIETISTEKERIEEERNVEKMKRSQLENTVNELKETVMSLKEEEERLRSNVAELEKKNIEDVEREKEMAREIDGLVEEKKEMEKKIEMLVEEKGALKKDLDDTLKQFNDQKTKIEGLVIEKNELVEDKARKEIKILELQKKMEEFKDAIQELVDSRKVQMEKLENLESEIAYHKGEIKQVKFERDEARKDYEEEKLNGFALKEKIDEMEKSIKKKLEWIKEMESEKIKITEEKKELGNRCEMFTNEISSTETTLAKIRKEFDELRCKVDLENANLGRILKMLKGTAELVCSNDENGVDVVEKEVNGDEQFIADFELIKNAFKSKESKVEDMARELEFLQNSVADANKKNSFWTLISSAAFLAAVSLAYIARVH